MPRKGISSLVRRQRESLRVRINYLVLWYAYSIKASILAISYVREIQKTDVKLLCHHLKFLAGCFSHVFDPIFEAGHQLRTQKFPAFLQQFLLELKVFRLLKVSQFVFESLIAFSYAKFQSWVSLNFHSLVPLPVSRLLPASTAEREEIMVCLVEWVLSMAEEVIQCDWCSIWWWRNNDSKYLQSNYCWNVHRNGQS